MHVAIDEALDVFSMLVDGKIADAMKVLHTAK